MTFSEPMVRRRPSSSAFTLLELVLVMLILAIISAILVPSLQRFSAGQRTENVVTTVLTLANHARAQAASEGRVYRMNFDTQKNDLWLTAQNAGVFEELKDDYGQHFTMPKGVKMDVTVQIQPNMMLVVPQNVQQNAAAVSVPFGQPLTQSSNSLMQNSRVDPGTYMEFQPSGRVDPVLIKVTDQLGAVINMGCQSSTETVHVLTAAEMR